MRGGKREGSGRKRNDPPTKGFHVYITEDEARLLREWGRGDLSAGLRWLIERGEFRLGLFTPRSRHPPLP